MRKYLCAMSAKNLPQSYFFPRGAYLYIYTYIYVYIDVYIDRYIDIDAQVPVRDERQEPTAVGLLPSRCACIHIYIYIDR